MNVIHPLSAAREFPYIEKTLSFVHSEDIAVHVAMDNTLVINEVTT